MLFNSRFCSFLPEFYSILKTLLENTVASSTERRQVESKKIGGTRVGETALEP
jgi:hypothetical protein